MNIFILFGTLLWMFLLAALFLGLVGLLIAAAVRKSWKLALWSIGGTASVALVVSGIFLGLSYLYFKPYDPVSEAELNAAYRADFGALPPPGVTVLKARQVIIMDSGYQWLLLKATPEEIERHIALGFFKIDTAPPDYRGAAGSNAPDWWKPPATGLSYYENRTWPKGGWENSEAFVGIDTTSNIIWFVSRKLD